MSRLLFILVFFIGNRDVIGQTAFLYSESKDNDNIILDVKIYNSKVYALEYTLGSYKLSNLLVLDTIGHLLENISLTNSQFVAMRFLNIQNDSLIILGRFISDTCTSSIVTSVFDLNSHDLSIISSVSMCDRNVQNLRITKKLDSGSFIFGYWVDKGWQMFLLEMNTSFQLRPFLDSIEPKWISIDFSRHGYVLKDDGLCNFYDRDFNYRKQRQNQIVGVYHIHETHVPFDKNYILENFGGSLDYEDYGQHVRIVDSNLHVINHLIISPGSGSNLGEMSPPFFGGIDFLTESSIWIAGNYNITGDLQSPTHFNVSKADHDLNLICNQYVGFDAYYRMYGITATPDGGALIFGTKITSTYDPYILKVGPNCELPSTAVNNPSPLISISVYPNPTINSLSFDVHGFDPTSLRVEIFTPEGITLFTADDLSRGIEVKDLPAGQYFYRILQKEKVLGVGPWVKL